MIDKLINSFIRNGAACLVDLNTDPCCQSPRRSKSTPTSIRIENKLAVFAVYPVHLSAIYGLHCVIINVVQYHHASLTNDHQPEGR